MRHYVITGGAGFIGSNLVGYLLKSEKEITITIIDDFDPFYSRLIKESNIAAFKSDLRVRMLEYDLAATASSELAEKIKGPVDVIVHLAAKAGVRPSIFDPLAYQLANVVGLQNLLDVARKKDCRQFVFASSSSVYGINDHFPWKENEQLLPISPYAMTKLAGEMLGHVYSRLFDIRFIALRLFTVYGPAQRPDLAIHKFTKAILDNAPITMYGDGTTSRDYTYVGDIVRGLAAAMNYEKTKFEIINLGNNYSISLKELIRSVEQIVGKKALIEQLPEQPGDVPRTFADISKAKKLLNYHPNTQLNAGLREFYKWYTEHAGVLAL